MDWLTFAARIGTAAVLGAAIGLERQWRQHTAGLRTNTLVCLGAALFVAMGALIAEPSRVAAQVVSGIGFLGGGVILREGFTVRGMNTAATLWCSAAVGVLAGTGFLVEAALGTAAVLIVHLGLRPVAVLLEKRLQLMAGVETNYRIKVTCQHPHEALVRTVFLRHINSQPRMTLQGLSTQPGTDSGDTDVIADVYAAERDDRIIEGVVARLSIEPGVSAVSWERVLR